jgi:hypothetical protein
MLTCQLRQSRASFRPADALQNTGRLDLALLGTGILKHPESSGHEVKEASMLLRTRSLKPDVPEEDQVPG